MLGRAFWQHWWGLPMDDVQIYDVSHPRAEMFFHLGVEWMHRLVVLGLGVVGPFVASSTGQASTFNTMARVSFRCGAAGAVAALAVGPAHYLYAYHNKPDVEIKNKCVMIRRMPVVAQSERTSLLGAAVGYGAAVVCRHPSKIPGPVFGLCAGLLLAQIYDCLVEEDEHNASNFRIKFQQTPG